MKHALSNICLALVIVLIVVMAGATIFEKFISSSAIIDVVYSSWWFCLLWAVLAVLSIVVLLMRGVARRPVVMVLHLSFVVILLGALITHVFGVQGSIHLRADNNAVTQYMTDGDRQQILPYSMTLDRFEVVYYPGTETPADFVTYLTVNKQGKSLQKTISVNKILEFDGYRFVNSSYDSDMQGITLSVSHDVCGTTLTHVGYWLLFTSIIGFFFIRHTHFKSLVKALMTLCTLLSAQSIEAADAPKTLPLPQAENMGRLMVSYNGRICPVSTLAHDLVQKVYGSPSYQGLSADQILSGWIFFPETWIDEPFVKVKNHKLLGLDTKYVSLQDYYAHSRDLDYTNAAICAACENFSILQMLTSGQMLKIFPHDGRWYSPIDRLPETMVAEQNIFARNAINYLTELALTHDYDNFDNTIGKIAKYQNQNAGDTMPPSWRIGTEHFYVKYCNSKPLAIFLVCVGLTLYFLSVSRYKRWSGLLNTTALCISILTLLILTGMIVLRGTVSGHFPLSNGYETMQAMAWCALLAGLVLRRTYALSIPSSMIVAGLALMVAMMGESNPQITSLAPVLSSPLLSIHVMLVMVAYALLGIIMINGVTGLAFNYRGLSIESQRLMIISQVMLYPAVFCLAAGIFVGAIWANVSWGRYWGWDPKEVWALITMLIYMLPLHTRLFKWFDGERNFHIFAIFAFLSVLITYFGVNFLLGGMHSYA